MSNETVEALKAARALIDTPEKWTKEACVRDAAGYSVHNKDDDAVCFCIVGALHRGSAPAYVDNLLRHELPPEHVGSLYVFNDDPATTHADVMALFDRAIARAEREA